LVPSKEYTDFAENSWAIQLFFLRLKLVRFGSNFNVPNRPYDICVLSAFV
jgi:hypothetical protein